jgi:hypothetical protein
MQRYALTAKAGERARGARPFRLVVIHGIPPWGLAQSFNGGLTNTDSNP